MQCTNSSTAKHTRPCRSHLAVSKSPAVGEARAGRCQGLGDGNALVSSNISMHTSHPLVSFVHLRAGHITVNQGNGSPRQPQYHNQNSQHTEVLLFHCYLLTFLNMPPGIGSMVEWLGALLQTGLQRAGLAPAVAVQDGDEEAGSSSDSRRRRGQASLRATLAASAAGAVCIGAAVTLVVLGRRRRRRGPADRWVATWKPHNSRDTCVLRLG